MMLLVLVLLLFGCRYADIYDITIIFSIIMNEKSDEETDLFECDEGRSHMFVIQYRDE